ncbi:MAG: hypothetical protein CFH05_01244, partial [Alphaproteobacteria bacterium MarineAlpha3_Bin4]
MEGHIQTQAIASARHSDVVELAQATSEESVGKVEVAKGNVSITRTDGTKVKAAVGAEIFQGDTVETDAEGSIGIVFADNSTFSLAESGSMVIDEMVYDPGSQQGSSSLNIAQGVFTFVSGQIAKTDVDAMTITTPTATVGIRGTAGGGKATEARGDTFSLFPDPVTGVTGEITISTQVGSQTLNIPNQTTRIANSFSLPSKPIVLPASAVNQFYGSAIAAAPPPPAQ